MADVTLTTIDAMMKELYSGKTPHDVAVLRKPLLEWMPKADNFVGEYLVVPLTYAHGAGRSSIFATAQSNASGGTHVKWVVGRKPDYAVLTIDAETMKASKSDLGAFVQARKWEVDGMLDELGRSAHAALYGDGKGTLGTVGSGTASPITLANVADARNFYKGMKINANDGTNNRAGTGTVTAVNRDTGVITYSGTITSLAVGDKITIDGDAGGAGNAVSTKKITGLAGWIPLTAPTGGDSHFSVDRSPDPVLLAGERLDATGNSIEENLMTLCERIGANGGRPDACFMNMDNFADFCKNLNAQVVRDAGGQAVTGFSGIKVYTSVGVVEVMPDYACPANRMYVLQRDTWTLHHLEGFPHVVEDDGLMALRQASSDGVEIRMRYWANLVCRAPGWNGVASI